MHPTMQRLFEATGKSPTEVSIDMGESPQTITNWSKRGISKRAAINVAKVYGLDSIWLLTGQNIQSMEPWESRTTYDDGLASRQVPIISMVQAGHWTPVMASDLSEETEWIPWIKEVGNNGFGVIVSGYSMSPYFLPNDRLYVNPDMDAANEDLVIAMCENDSEATFKQLIVDSGKKYLVPLNKEWLGGQAIELDRTCTIKGVVVSSIRPIDKRLYRSAHS